MDKESGRIVFTSSWMHDPAHLMNEFIKEESHKTILHEPPRPGQAEGKRLSGRRVQRGHETIRDEQNPHDHVDVRTY